MIQTLVVAFSNIAAVIILAAIAVTAHVYRRLPARLALSFSLSGLPQGSSPKPMVYTLNVGQLVLAVCVVIGSAGHPDAPLSAKTVSAMFLFTLALLVGLTLTQVGVIRVALGRQPRLSPIPLFASLAIGGLLAWTANAATE